MLMYALLEAVTRPMASIQLLSKALSLKIQLFVPELSIVKFVQLRKRLLYEVIWGVPWQETVTRSNRLLVSPSVELLGPLRKKEALLKLQSCNSKELKVQFVPVV